ncbi:MAG: hypothetical protein HY905_01470 [Deltaproteobacteria bacterium]|nr:hypothetical protein [Deltaproteobacteria bacterium]
MRRLARSAALAGLLAMLSAACGGDSASPGDTADSGGEGADAADGAPDGEADAGDSTETATDVPEDEGATEADAEAAGCTPVAETCNGLDDDCDGLTDEDDPGLCPTGRFCTAGHCRSGGTLQWIRAIPSWTIPQGVAVDPSGQLTVVGCLRSTVDFGGGDRVPFGGSAGFVVSYDAEGNYLWDHVFGGDGDSLDKCARAVAVRSIDSGIAIAGSYTGTLSFGGPARTSNGGMDAYVVVLDRLGNWYWDEAWGGSGDDDASALAFPDADLFVGGSARGSFSIGGSPLSLGVEGDGYAAGMTPDGGGAVTWTKAISTTGEDAVTSVAVDGGSVVLGGYVAGIVDLGGGARAWAGGTDGFAAIVESRTGGWSADRVFGGTGADAVWGAARPEGSEAVVGGDFDQAIDFGGGMRTPLGTEGDAFTLKLGRDASWLWDDEVRTSGSPDRIGAVATNGFGEFVVAGAQGGMPLVRRYARDGSIVWNTVFGGGEPDLERSQVTGIAFGPGDTIVVTGSVTGSVFTESDGTVVVNGGFFALLED